MNEQTADDLSKRHRGDELTLAHLLIPTDTTIHDEGLVGLAEIKKDGNRRALRFLVAKEDVGVDACAILVEGLEAQALPVLSRIEVDRRPNVGLGRTIGVDDLGRANALQTIDHEGRIEKADVIPLDIEVIPPHTQLYVGNAGSGTHGSNNAALPPNLGDNFTLVLVDQDFTQGRKVEYTPKDNTFRSLIQGVVGKPNGHRISLAGTQSKPSHVNELPRYFYTRCGVYYNLF